MYTYYFCCKDNDPALTKYLVLYILVVETLNTGFSMYMVYEPLVLQFGTSLALQDFPLSLATEPALMVAISTPIQIFIAWRIVRFQHSFWIGGLICLLAVLSFAGGVLSSFQIRLYASFATKREETMSTFLWLISAATADVLIAGSLSWSLYRRRTGLPSTDAVLSRIIIFTVETGLVTSITALCTIITLVALPIENSTDFVFNILLLKIYGNFLMANLNARASWNNGLQHVNGSLLFDDPSSTLPPLQFIAGSSPSNVRYDSRFRVNPVNV
ncbi:hypothetical protein BDZ97DRAFT_1922198 [Flammula alnicola]|nr:hypothetical protein BDZ97DRAFT_1922198 [Flammula alnicola]